MDRVVLPFSTAEQTLTVPGKKRTKRVTSIASDMQIQEGQDERVFPRVERLVHSRGFLLPLQTPMEDEGQGACIKARVMDQGWVDHWCREGDGGCHGHQGCQLRSNRFLRVSKPRNYIIKQLNEASLPASLRACSVTGKAGP